MPMHLTQKQPQTDRAQLAGKYSKEPLAPIIYEINFEAILGTSFKGIYAYFAELVTENRSKLIQNL